MSLFVGDMPHASGFLRAFQFPLLVPIKLTTRDRNWEVQAGSPDKIFDKKMPI
jgi:hypothetical protein